jgi:hypothetical protein
MRANHVKSSVEEDRKEEIERLRSEVIAMTGPPIQKESTITGHWEPDDE